MSEPQIFIKSRDRLANQMFQLMVAVELRRRAGCGLIVGYNLPEWGLVSPPAPPPGRPMVVLREQRFDLDMAAFLLKSGIVETVVIEGWGMRLTNFRGPEHYRELFSTKLRGASISDDELLIHIRAEDILSGWHHLYFPLPFSFYEGVIEETGLRPVFMGQIGEDEYSRALFRKFSNARFLPRQSVVEDFETIRNAAHVVLSLSSFAWLSAWLSKTAKSIHLPVAGLFAPSFDETMLVPANDNRYRFYKMSIPDHPTRNSIDLVEWAEGEAFRGILDTNELRNLFLFRIFGHKS